MQDALLQAGELLARGQKGAEEVRKPGGSPWQQELPRERLEHQPGEVIQRGKEQGS